MFEVEKVKLNLLSPKGQIKLGVVVGGVSEHQSTIPQEIFLSPKSQIEFRGGGGGGGG